ncbi:hydrogenase maturation peptidase HycI [Yersinia ruckeri]|uniref:Hydrogenase 3 maturation protease n=1 Tax=Yersinia ruckeri TaxID=29486 RepID=A0A085U8A5_YERRU|nr:hydrogenase maturation peptidase HycI [Yersinia ruckeri]AKA37041.1 hydrogenase 3 maturation protease [Yersinia ruckeri]ARZ01247.1 hydrogenase 3 maturation protease [Yersinia ruckeri]EKN3344982.1 hydrogenase maturation peptidase HycI [Yersinia ruckeri]EKN3360400.1 hydrogenase maturation peptidase HycI [Yersinia ruckeri]EKN4181573.1 hydrogenase maturation peptidase HycI [Yersinia ruckeri]
MPDFTSRYALLCVGNSMMGDDGAGPRLAELCAEQPLAGWTVVDGGAAPENDIGFLRELQPQHLVIVDATDMGLAPGEMRIIDEKDIGEMFMMTTHNLPLTYLMQQLREDIPQITFVGIQPDVVAFYYPMSAVVEQAVCCIHQRLPDLEIGLGIALFQAESG